MCVNSICHSVGDWSTVSLHLLQGRLVYNFSTTLDLTAYGSRIPWDGEFCGGKLFTTMVTFHCESSNMQSAVMQYDADNCRLLMRTYDSEACSQWQLLLPSAWNGVVGAGQCTKECWNSSALFALEETDAPLTIPFAALPLQPGFKGRARVLIYRILSEAVTSKGTTTAALPVYVPASYFVRASQAVDAAALSASTTNSILVAMYVSGTSHAAAVTLHKALHRSSQSFTLLLLCSDDLKRFMKVSVTLYAIFFAKSLLLELATNITLDHQDSGDGGKLSGAVVADSSVGRWAGVRSYVTRLTTSGFSHVLLLTPEVDCSETDFDELMRYVRDFSVELAQPSVAHGCPCYSGQMLQRWSFAMRWVDIVESQFMIFSRTVWLRMISRVLIPSSPVFWSESNGIEFVLRSALDLQRMAVIDAAVVAINCLDLAAAIALSPIPAIGDAQGSQIPRQHVEYAVLNARRQLAYSVVMSSMFASTGRANLQVLGYQMQPWAASVQIASIAWRSAAHIGKIPSLHGDQSLWSQVLKVAFKPWQSVSLTADAILSAILFLRDWDPCVQHDMLLLQRLGLRCIDISGGVFIHIRKGKMHVTQIGRPYQSRARSAAHLVFESLLVAKSAGSEIISDVDLVINTGDHPIVISKSKSVQAPIFSVATSDRHIDVPWPCFSWWDWTEAGISNWPQQQAAILKAASEWPWKKRVPVLFWRGSDNGKYAENNTIHGKRRPLVQISRENTYPSGIIRPGLMEGVLATFITSRHPLNHVPLADHCRYRSD
jgi:hypothetical protein